MQAVILAAGLGSRLGKYTAHDTKCMVEVNGERLIDRALGILERKALERIVIVSGYSAERLEKYVKEKNINTEIIFVRNEIYDQTNNIYSLRLASKYLSECDTILIESDLIFDEEIIDEVLNDARKNLVVVDEYLSWMDGTCIKGSKGKIVDFIDRDKFSFDEAEEYFKTVNIYKFSKDFYRDYYSKLLGLYIDIHGDNEYYEAVINTLSAFKNNDLEYLSIKGRKWYEIDDVADLKIAEVIFSKKSSDRYIKLMESYGGYWRYENLKDFCYLVNPFFPTDRCKKELEFNFKRVISDYPSTSWVQNLLACKIYGLDNEDCTCVGNGGTEIIKIFPHVLEGTIGIYTPTFNEYINVFGERAKIFENKKYDLSLCVQDYMKIIDACDNLLIVNPENPTGKHLSEEEVIEIIEYAEDQGKTVIYDESFADFMDSEIRFSLIRSEILSRYQNLIILKSVSKTYGVAGLRLGFVFSGNLKVIKSIQSNLPIWNINSVAENFLQIIGKYKKEYSLSCDRLATERQRFRQKLQEIEGVFVHESQSNYFLVEIDSKYDVVNLCDQLAKNDILVKNVSNKICRQSQFLRIAIRDKDDNDYFFFVLSRLMSSVTHYA